MDVTEVIGKMEEARMYVAQAQSQILLDKAEPELLDELRRKVGLARQALSWVDEVLAKVTI